MRVVDTIRADLSMYQFMSAEFFISCIDIHPVIVDAQSDSLANIFIWNRIIILAMTYAAVGLNFGILLLEVFVLHCRKWDHFSPLIILEDTSSVSFLFLEWLLIESVELFSDCDVIFLY